MAAQIFEIQFGSHARPDHVRGPTGYRPPVLEAWQAELLIALEARNMEAVFGIIRRAQGAENTASAPSRAILDCLNSADEGVSPLFIVQDLAEKLYA